MGFQLYHHDDLNKIISSEHWDFPRSFRHSPAYNSEPAPPILSRWNSSIFVGFPQKPRNNLAKQYTKDPKFNNNKKKTIWTNQEWIFCFPCFCLFTWEINRGIAWGTGGGNGMFVLPVSGRVRKERALNRVERRWSENAFCGGESEINGQVKGGEEVEERETEELWSAKKWLWECSSLSHLLTIWWLWEVFHDFEWRDESLGDEGFRIFFVTSLSWSHNSAPIPLLKVTLKDDI